MRKLARHVALAVVGALALLETQASADGPASPTPPPAPAENPWVLPAIVGWGLSGAVAVPATICAAVARDNSPELTQASIILFSTAATFALVSTYFTFRMLEASTRANATSASSLPFDVRVGPSGMTAFGTF